MWGLDQARNSILVVDPLWLLYLGLWVVTVCETGVYYPLFGGGDTILY